MEPDEEVWFVLARRGVDGGVARKALGMDPVFGGGSLAGVEIAHN